MPAWAYFWQCCEPAEDKGAQMVMESTTDEGLQIPTLLPPGPNKNRDAACPTKKPFPLADVPSVSPGATSEAPIKTTVKEHAVKIPAEAEARSEESAHEDTGGTGMPVMIANDPSGHDAPGRDKSREEVDAAIVSEELDSTAEAELEAKREECIQTARSRSQSRHMLADDKERDRLETLVAAFSKSAVHGRPCTYLDYRTGKQTTATYQINTDLTLMTIAEQSNGRRSLFKRNGLPLDIKVASIVDLDTFEDCSMCLEARVVKRLQPQEKERFLMIFYDSDRTSRTEMCCLLLDTVESRDTFQQSFRVLKGGD